MLYKLHVELDEPPKQKHEVISVTESGKTECVVEFKTKRLLNNFLIKHQLTDKRKYVYKINEDKQLIYVGKTNEKS